VVVALALGAHDTGLAPRWLFVPLEVVHLLAVGIWIGGLTVLAPTARRAKLDALRRFSVLALRAVLVVAVTGEPATSGGVVPRLGRPHPTGDPAAAGQRGGTSGRPGRRARPAQSTVSTHLACPRDSGLVVGRPHGRQTFYSLAHPELLDLLGAAEQLLDRADAAVALCPHLRHRRPRAAMS